MVTAVVERGESPSGLPGYIYTTIRNGRTADEGWCMRKRDAELCARASKANVEDVYKKRWYQRNINRHHSKLDWTTAFDPNRASLHLPDIIGVD